mgnify:CR=1 FL=1
MKIAFDAKRITHNATGLGNYSRFVVNSLSASFPEHTYQLYTPGKGKEALRKRIEERPSVSFHYPEGRFDKLFPSLWRTSGLTTTLRKEHVDLFHGLSNEIPMNLKRVVDWRNIIRHHRRSGNFRTKQYGDHKLNFEWINCINRKDTTLHSQLHICLQFICRKRIKNFFFYYW